VFQCERTGFAALLSQYQIASYGAMEPIFDSSGHLGDQFRSWVHAVNMPCFHLAITCPANQFGSIYIQVPGPGKENDDHNPQRIAPRNLFDVAVGDDNLFRGDRYRWSLRFTVINLTDKVSTITFQPSAVRTT
jgi:hypothetical protein